MRILIVSYGIRADLSLRRLASVDQYIIMSHSGGGKQPEKSVRSVSNSRDHWIFRFYQETSDVLTGRSRSNKRQSEPKRNPSN